MPLELSVAEVSSVYGGSNGPENVLKNDNSYWHSHGDAIPYICLKMEKEEEVFTVKVIDRLDCVANGCTGRYQDVQVRVALTPSYEEAVSCGWASGDGIEETVHM